MSYAHAEKAACVITQYFILMVHMCRRVRHSQELHHVLDAELVQNMQQTRQWPES